MFALPSLCFKGPFEHPTLHPVSKPSWVTAELGTPCTRPSAPETLARVGLGTRKINVLASAQRRLMRTWHNLPFTRGRAVGAQGSTELPWGCPWGRARHCRRALLQRRAPSPWLGTGAETPPHPPAASVGPPLVGCWERPFHCLSLPFGEGKGAHWAVWWGKEGSDSAPGLRPQCLPSSVVSKPSWGAGCCSYGFEHQEMKSS